MAYTKALYEIVDEVRKSKNVKIKADILKQNESTALIDLLQLTYNPSIKWLLPEGEPPYTPAEGTNDEGCLLYTSPSPRDKRQSRMPSSA